MKLKEIMTGKVEIVHPGDSLQTAARKMRDNDIGFLPVFNGDHMIGVVSDRDLAIRALAEGKSPNSIIDRDLISSPVIYCYEDQDIEEAAQLMRENQIRRLVILDRSKSMVGVVSLCDVAKNGSSDLSGEILQDISEPLVASK